MGGIAVNESSDLAKSTVALLDQNGRPFCTATVIGTSHLVSAAHCFDGGGRASMIGIGRNARPEQSIKVLGHVSHPRYSMQAESPGLNSDDNPQFDIAVVAISSTNPSLELRAVSLADQQSIVSNAQVIISGFGSTDTGREDSGILRSVETSLGRVFLNRREVDTRSLGKSTCFGDSGGPLYLKSGEKILLLGATSRGTDEVCSKGYSIYTDVTKFQGWMKCSYAKLGVPVDSLIDDESSKECSNTPPKPNDQNSPPDNSDFNQLPDPVDNDQLPDLIDWWDSLPDWDDACEDCDYSDSW